MKIERTYYHHMFLLLTVKKKFGILSITWWGRICTIKDYVHVGFILLVKYFYRPPPPALLRKNQPILIVIVIVKNNSYNVRIIYANLWKNASKLKTKPHQITPSSIAVHDIVYNTSPFYCFSPTPDKPSLLGYIEVLYKCHFDSSVLLLRLENIWNTISLLVIYMHIDSYKLPPRTPVHSGD